MALMRALLTMDDANAFAVRELPLILEQWQPGSLIGGRGQSQSMHPRHSRRATFPEGLRESNDDSAPPSQQVHRLKTKTLHR
jgi:hypothetical protein